MGVGARLLRFPANYIRGNQARQRRRGLYVASDYQTFRDLGALPLKQAQDCSFCAAASLLGEPAQMDEAERAN